MEIKANTTVGEIVRQNFKTAQIFENINIDFCCGGEIPLSEACKKSGVDINNLIPEIEATLNLSDPDSKYIESLSLDKLCDYIVDRHHSYVNESIPLMNQKLQKLCDVHREKHPELFEIRDHFATTAGNLTIHMKKEELILFPYIHNMVRHEHGEPAKSFESGNILELINQMEEEHQAEGERFVKISGLSNNYMIPPDGCNTYDVTFKNLKEFDQDLHRHIHLENNILFKKAIELEKKLLLKKGSNVI